MCAPPANKSFAIGTLFGAVHSALKLQKSEEVGWESAESNGTISVFTLGRLSLSTLTGPLQSVLAVDSVRRDESVSMLLLQANGLMSG